jgi:hypothetical protein
MAATVLDTDEQDRFITDLTCTGVEDGVGGVWPVPRRQNRVGVVSVE